MSPVNPETGSEPFAGIVNRSQFSTLYRPNAPTRASTQMARRSETETMIPNSLPQRKPPRIRRLMTGRARLQPVPLQPTPRHLPTRWHDLLPYVAQCCPVVGLVVATVNVMMHEARR